MFGVTPPSTSVQCGAGYGTKRSPRLRVYNDGRSGAVLVTHAQGVVSPFDLNRGEKVHPIIDVLRLFETESGCSEGVHGFSP